MPHKISNIEFLKTIKSPHHPLMGIEPPEGEFLICHRLRDAGNWKAKTVKHGENIDWPNHDAFFNIGMVKPVKGKLERKKVNFAALPCIVFDDVGTKANTPNVEPSWIIETSPNNEQWGYILYPAITDIQEAEQLMNAVINAGYSDKGANSPTTRCMRLPVGSNGKKKHMDNNDGKPVPHKLNLWKPSNTFTKQELIKKLGLVLEKPKTIYNHNTKNDHVAREFYSERINEMRNRLKFIDPDCDRSEWIKIGMIIYNETGGSAEGFALWDAWSAGYVRA